MMSFMALLCLLVLTGTTEASSSSSQGNYNYELSGAALTALYNSPVYKAELVRRPLGTNQRTYGLLSHSGVRVTLGDGAQWLIHKGNNFGISSQTVVTNAKYMGPEWTVRDTKDFEGTKTVGELVRAGGATYNIFTKNCHHAANAMMED